MSDEYREDPHHEEDDAAGDGFEAIAVIGLAGRFPGAADVDELWRNLLAGVESISFFSAEEMAASGVPAELYSHPDYVPARGLVDGPEYFDAELFGLSPREAEVMDPQNRLFLECCWQACEDAGYDPLSYPGRAGVYAGANASSYLLANLLTRPDLMAKIGTFQVRIGNEKDSLTTWVSYKLDLRGPAVTVQTACSTSLVAVHVACQGLLDGECDMALAGGVGVNFPLRSGYLYQPGGVLSPDGHCRPFDADAAGSVSGTGAGVVVLRRLSDALADGDPVRAVIRGTAVTNDGARRAGYTAPGVEGQMRAVAEALALAEVPPETVGYVETHGSATALGDPIEVEALTRAFRRGTDRRGFCALGSVKANVGHLDSAAGVTGLIKTVRALEAKQLPPCLHFRRPNPKIDFESSPFYVATEPAPWPEPAPGTPRRAGVSSFGIGGTNAHAVLEEAPVQEPGGPSRRWQQLWLSARTGSAVERACSRLADFLDDRAGVDLADVAFTLHAGRHPFRHRRAVICRDPADAVTVLRGGEPSRLLAGDAGTGEEEPGVAFLFPGLGDHHPGMTAELYREEPTFRAEVDRCAELLRPRLGVDLRDALFPGGTDAAGDGARAPGSASSEPDLRRLLGRGDGGAEAEDAGELGRTVVAHPAVFVVEYALARLLMEWGLAPKAMIGYSLGEYVAACLSGVLTLEAALELVAERARMIEELPEGAMLAVPLPAAELEGRLGPGNDFPELSLAAENGASLTVVAGEPAAVAAAAERLEAEGVACRRLRTRHAFHSAMMEPIRGPFAKRAAAAGLQPPEIPFLSNVTGGWVTAEEATDPEYWGRHLVAPVRFTEGVGELLRGGLALLEVGPGQSLTTLARQHADRRSSPAVVASLPDRRDGVSESAHLLSAVTRLWLAGVPVDAAGVYRHETRRRLPLPTYPFERRRYWVEPGEGSAAAPAAAAGGEREGKPADLARWFYQPGWRRSEPLGWRTAATRNAATVADGGPWLLFLDDAGVGRGLAARLRDAGAAVTTVAAGDGFERLDGDGADYRLEPGRPEGYGELLRTLDEEGELPRRVVHLWSFAPAAGDDTASAGAVSPELLDRGFYSLLFLAQAFGERSLPDTVEIAAVTDGVFEVTGAEALRPITATILGPCQVIPQEYPRLACRSVDLELPAGGAVDAAATSLLAELAGGFDDPVVAHRGRHRWLRTVEPVAVPEPAADPPLLRPDGVYLVTGGDGETGRVVAEELAVAGAARLAVVLPPGHEPDPEWRRRVEERSELLLLPAELADPASMAAAVAELRRHFGAGPHGVVHTAAAEDAGLVQLKSRELAAPVLAPKVTGTLALDAALGGAELDFFALFSSSTALLGGVGQVVECAADAFVDAFARHRAAAGGHTIAIGWDTFRWHHHPQQDALPEGLRRQLERNQEVFGIEPGECGRLLRRSLAAGLPQLWVTPRDLRAAAGEFEAMKTADLFAELGGEAGGHLRPELAVPYRAPEGEVETTLAELWIDAFGIDRVGVDDDFFDLEGNSLTAVQIVTRLRSTLHVDLPLAAIFEHPTIAGLAERIEELRREARELREVDALLAEIEGLSDDEAEALLTKEGEMA